MIRAGLSTACFYPAATELSLDLAAKTGASCAEIFVNAMQEFTIPFFDMLRSKAEAAGMDIVCIHPFTSGMENFTLFSDYPRRLQDGLNLYRRFFALTARIGARYFVLHGAKPNCCLDRKEICARFALLSDAAAQEGVVLLLENVSRCISCDPSFIRYMRAELGEKAAFVLDTKQALRSGSTAFDMIDAMGGALRHIHISDYRLDNDCVPPGRGGGLDMAAFIASLRALGYQGDLFIELYRDSYQDICELNESRQYLCNLLSISTDH